MIPIFAKKTNLKLTDMKKCAIYPAITITKQDKKFYIFELRRKNGQ